MNYSTACARECGSVGAKGKGGLRENRAYRGDLLVCSQRDVLGAAREAETEGRGVEGESNDTGKVCETCQGNRGHTLGAHKNLNHSRACGDAEVTGLFHDDRYHNRTNQKPTGPGHGNSVRA